MTTKIITSYVAILVLAIAMIGVTTAEASEVTGTLSSDSTTNNSDLNGNITGTVTGNSSSGGGGGGSVIGGSNNLDNTPSGAVLGATDSTTVQTPGFPNAGTAPQVRSSGHSLWTTIMNLLKTVLPF